MLFRRVFAGLSCLCAAGVCAQDAAIELRTTEVVPGIYMIDSANDVFVGGNMGLITGEDGVILIDDGLETIGAPLLNAIREETGASVDFLLNTHYHGDHVGSNAALAAQGATILAHYNIRKRMAESTGDQAYPDSALPVITYDDGVTLHLNGFTVQAVHVANAHTDGDSIIYFPDVNVIHTGDVLFNGMFPYIDLGGGGSVDGFIAALDRVIALADDETRIISGHGPLADRGDVQASRDMLADSLARVKVLVDEGRSEDEIVAANPLADYDADWTWGFITTERITRTLVQSLSR